MFTELDVGILPQAEINKLKEIKKNLFNIC